jgi:hypothetical protein
LKLGSRFAGRAIDTFADRVLLIAGVDEDVHLLANEERNVLVLDAVDDLKDMRIDSLRAIASN